MGRPHGIGGIAGLGVAVAVMVLCCLGPALLVGTGLAAAVGGIAAPAVGLAGIVATVAGGAWFFRRRRHLGDEACCPPQHLNKEPSRSGTIKP